MMLVTGFGPFDIFSSNPSQSIAETLSAGYEDCEHRILPVVFGRARVELNEVLGDLGPEMVLSFGLNGNISYVALETVAVNIRYSEVPDNDGVIQPLARIDPDGPLVLESRLPVLDILTSLRDAGIPSRLSFSAGTYLCNETFYTLMQYCGRTGAIGGFIHVPMASNMVAQNPRLRSGPHMAMEMILEAARTVMDVSLRTRSSRAHAGDGRSNNTCR